MTTIERPRVLLSDEPVASLEVSFREPHAWMDAVSRRIETLYRLRDDWDGSGGRPVAIEPIHDAIVFLGDLLPSWCLPPDVVPTPRGGVQLEWHMGSLDVEAEFEPGDASVLTVSDDASGLWWTGAVADGGRDHFKALVPRLASARELGRVFGTA
jgi:hypothetical protein